MGINSNTIFKCVYDGRYKEDEQEQSDCVGLVKSLDEWKLWLLENELKSLNKSFSLYSLDFIEPYTEIVNLGECDVVDYIKGNYALVLVIPENQIYVRISVSNNENSSPNEMEKLVYCSNNVHDIAKAITDIQSFTTDYIYKNVEK